MAVELSYPEFEERVGAAFPEIAQSVATPRLRFTYGLVVFAFMSLGVAAIISPREYKDVLLATMLLIEVAGAFLILVVQLAKEWQNYKRQKNDFAIELETHFAGYKAIIEWLRIHPPKTLDDRLSYIQLRNSSMTQRLGIMMGGIERFGLLPVFAVLYVQFQNTELHWPPTFNAVPTILGCMLLSGYVAVLMSMSLRLRLALYERLLAEAIKQGPLEENPADATSG